MLRTVHGQNLAPVGMYENTENSKIITILIDAGSCPSTETAQMEHGNPAMSNKVIKVVLSFGGDPEKKQKKHPGFHSPDSQLSSHMMLTNDIDWQGSTSLNIEIQSVNPLVLTSLKGRACQV